MRLLMMWRDLVTVIHAAVGVTKCAYFKLNSLNTVP